MAEFPSRSLTVALIALASLLFASACSDEAGTTGTCTDCGSADGRGSRDTGSERDAGTDTGPADAGDADIVDVPTTDSGLDGTPSRSGGLVPEPPAIYISTPGVGTAQEEIVRVWNQTDETVVFHSAVVNSATPGFSLREAPVEASREPGQAIGFALRYEAVTNNDATAEIVVENSWGDPVTIPVTVAAKVGDDACIQVTPTSLSFGPIVRGSGTETQTFRIENCGAPTISVLRLDRGRVFGLLPTPDTFQWTSAPLPFPLNAGEAAEVSVTFSPGRAGTDRGAVDVVSNVSGSETIRVNLTGVTEVPPLEELDVHLRLNWDVEGGSDVDFHFYPESSLIFSCDDCFYSNMSPDWGVPGDITDDPFLDWDDLEGPGPENINVDELPDGNYIIAVHYYSDTGSSGSGEDNWPTPANATVEVFIGGVLRATYGPQHLEATDHTWNVARLEWPSGTLVELGDTFVVDRSDYTWCRSLL